ncbi:MAG: TetR/AcrR family transcriptional regulator, partial [Balneolaceae bacterium]
MESAVIDKKESILRAGRQAVARYGYQKTTLSDIATLCSISKTSIYYYFENKEDLFR